MNRFAVAVRQFFRVLVRALPLLCFALASNPSSRAAPRDFSLPAQSAAQALLAFSAQAEVEVLFAFDELDRVAAHAVSGRLEPEAALAQLLEGTGFVGRRNRAGKFLVRAAPATGAVHGRILLPDGRGIAGIAVRLLGTAKATATDRDGEFNFDAVPAGSWRLHVASDGFQPVELVDLTVEPHRVLTLAPVRLRLGSDVTVLAPYTVNAESNSLRTSRNPVLIARRAAGNLDLPRTVDDALPFAVYNRDQIVRSGAVNLNQFLSRELLDSDAAASPAESSTETSLVTTGSSNLQLRGFERDETIIFINGRRLPETIQDVSGRLGAPDVNIVPLSLIEQVEVLPVSAAALYGGNAVGGVINLVLRPEFNSTEVHTSYTNTLAGYDAPEKTVALLHGRTLLDGRLRVRLNATFSRNLPPTEAELGLIAARPVDTASDQIFRATPNVRSLDGAPVLPGGSSRFTSVAPGADGLGGLAAFAGRDGVRSTALFRTPGGFSSSPATRDYAYGRRQDRATWFGSLNYDLTPRVQLGLDGSYSATQLDRGYNVFSQDLRLPATSPFNPFGREVAVSLNEIPRALGPDYTRVRQEAYSVLAGALIRLPAEWRVATDLQFARSVTRLRGIVEVDPTAWQRLVDQGRYNPLRDTQTTDAPAAFYDEALVFYGGRGQTVTFSDYDALDAAVRATNQDITLPTGRAVVNAGVDYRRNHRASYVDYRRYGNGGIVGDTQTWGARSIERYSGFGELQAPLLPSAWLPRWLASLEADVAARYIASNNASEAYVAPTLALKAEFVGGLAFRGSFSTSSRFPTPGMSRQIVAPGGGTGGSEGTFIFDPILQQGYVVNATQPVDPGLKTEDAITQTAGVIFQRGRTRRLRLALDFVDTRKTNELFDLKAQDAVNLETVLPDRVRRDASGRITQVSGGIINAARRHSQNWNFSTDVSLPAIGGGTLDLYSRWVYFQRYDRQLLPGSRVVDQIDHPDGSMSNVHLLRHRLNVGASWNRPAWGLGADAHYFGSRRLPDFEWASQGSDRIASTWQADVYIQGDLARWLPWTDAHHGLRAQLRVNNVFAAAFPRYVNAPSGAGVQSYGDWRGRTLSLSLTATF
ncbi:MAG: TonB-dependent receptor [Opitutae bacterium]|nr:TonB-dependent receptor [Opitutae bacterium]